MSYLPSEASAPPGDVFPFIHWSIFFIPLTVSCWGLCGAGTCPSWLWEKGRPHPQLVASQSEGTCRDSPFTCVTIEWELHPRCLYKAKQVNQYINIDYKIFCGIRCKICLKHLPWQWEVQTLFSGGSIQKNLADLHIQSQNKNNLLKATIIFFFLKH